MFIFIHNLCYKVLLHIILNGGLKWEPRCSLSAVIRVRGVNVIISLCITIKLNEKFNLCDMLILKLESSLDNPLMILPRQDSTVYISLHYFNSAWDTFFAIHRLYSVVGPSNSFLSETTCFKWDHLFGMNSDVQSTAKMIHSASQ